MAHATSGRKRKIVLLREGRAEQDWARGLYEQFFLRWHGWLVGTGLHV
jgi:hypothetical protein